MGKKKRHRGHYCYVCDKVLANEKFSGKGHKKHICKKCMRKTPEERKKIIEKREEWEKEALDISKIFEQVIDMEENNEVDIDNNIYEDDLLDEENYEDIKDEDIPF
ncbi:MAG: hypothetical protein FH753_09065 [Firmicutes bacterium]|nr:hypothetical protein [Bacillota bacterium]